jgi:hypothetical protein
MVRHDQHRETLSDQRPNEVVQPIDFAFEARRDVVDGRNQQAIGGGGHGRPICALAGIRASRRDADEQRFT